MRLLCHVSHTEIHTKNSMVWTAGRSQGWVLPVLWKMRINCWRLALKEDGTIKNEGKKELVRSTWLALGNTLLGLSCVLACVVSHWSTPTFYWVLCTCCCCCYIVVAVLVGVVLLLLSLCTKKLKKRKKMKQMINTKRKREQGSTPKCVESKEKLETSST